MQKFIFSFAYLFNNVLGYGIQTEETRFDDRHERLLTKYGTHPVSHLGTETISVWFSGLGTNPYLGPKQWKDLTPIPAYLFTACRRTTLLPLRTISRLRITNT